MTMAVPDRALLLRITLEQLRRPSTIPVGGRNYVSTVGIMQPTAAVMLRAACAAPLSANLIALGTTDKLPESISLGSLSEGGRPLGSKRRRTSTASVCGDAWNTYF